MANPTAFSRRVMHNIVVDQTRARARRPPERQLSHAAPISDPRSADPHGAIELRAALMHRCTDDVYPRASITTQVVRRQRRRHRRQLVSVAATSAAVGTAAAVVAAAPRPAGQAPRTAHGRRPAIKLTAEQQTLHQLSTTAARQPAGQGRYVALSEKIHGGVSTSVIDSATGNTWAYQKVPGAPSVGPEQCHRSPTRAQFGAMPTGPVALRALLISQYDKKWNQQQALVLRLRKPRKGQKGQPNPVPRDPDPESAAGKVFTQAYDMLWNPLVGPALMGALFKVLTGTPGVRVDRHAADMLGGPAVKITWAGFAGGASYATYEDPATAAVLEQTSDFPGAGGYGYGLYLSVTYSKSVPPDPYTRG